MVLKRYAIHGIILFSIAILLSACSDEGKVKSATTSDKAENELGLSSFELEVDTKDHKDAIEASIDIEGSVIEAEYVNRIEPKSLKGDKAYDELQPILKEIGLTKEMSKEEVIEAVTKAFEVEDYKKFDLEVEFSDGDHKEFKDKK